MPLSDAEKLDYIDLYKRIEKGEELTDEEKNRYVNMYKTIESDTQTETPAVAETIQPKQSDIKSLLEQYGQKYVKPTFEGVGAGLGGIAGTSLGPLGTVGGAGLGYTGGKQAYDILANIIDPEQNKIRSIPQQIRELPSDLMMGAMSEMGGQVGGKVASGALNLAKQGALKGASALYNIPKKAIETYLKNTKAVKKAGVVTPFQSGLEAKEAIETAIENRKAELNNMISTGLEKGKQLNASVDIRKTIASLKSALKEIEPSTEINKQYRAEIEKQIKNLDAYNKKYNGFVPVKVANQLKHDLQNSTNYFDDMLKRSVSRKDAGADAIKGAASNLRKQTQNELKNIAPEFESAYSQYENLNDIIKDRKFASAFSKENIENTMKNVESGNKGYLKDLIEKTDLELGTNLGERTKEAFAAKYFNDPDIMSILPTGRSVLPTILGGAIGNVTGKDQTAMGAGALLGLGLSSPLLLKAGAPLVNKAAQSLLVPAVKTGAQTAGRFLPEILKEYLKKQENE